MVSQRVGTVGAMCTPVAPRSSEHEAVGAVPAVAPPVVLVIEDDADARVLANRAATAEGFAVVEANTGGSALALLRARPVDVVVLDLGLPDRDGFALLRDIRRASTAPMVVVSGDARLESRVAGLRLGADDYMVKPVDVAELGARVSAALRRTGRPPPLEAPAVDVMRSGPLVVDLIAHEVRRDGRVLALRPRERALLELLVRHPRQALTRDQLLAEAWHTAYLSHATVTEHVRTLRTRLGDPPAPHRWIVTVRGVGYRFDP
jgi:DNA-binding response OmpR family regulator